MVMKEENHEILV